MRNHFSNKYLKGRVKYGKGRHHDNKGLENERRIDHLVNLVERKTRTERHLEEHSDISSSLKIYNMQRK